MSKESIDVTVNALSLVIILLCAWGIGTFFLNDLIEDHTQIELPAAGMTLNDCPLQEVVINNTGSTSYVKMFVPYNQSRFFQVYNIEKRRGGKAQLFLHGNYLQDKADGINRTVYDNFTLSIDGEEEIIDPNECIYRGPWYSCIRNFTINGFVPVTVGGAEHNQVIEVFIDI